MRGIKVRKMSVWAALAVAVCGAWVQASEMQVRSLEEAIGNQEYQTTINNSHTVVGASRDKFQHLINMAHKSQSVSFGEVEGVYTGRCYDMINRNLPRNSALLILQVESIPSDGPLFPKEKLVIEGGAPTESADYFDGMSKPHLTSMLMSVKSIYSSVVESPLQVVLNAAHTLSFVKSSNILLSYVTANQDRVFPVRGNGNITVKKGDVWCACYYFNKR